MAQKKPPLQFSIRRLALALGVFGIPFAFLANYGPAGAVIASGIGCALATLILSYGRASQSRILNLLIFAAMAGAIWLHLFIHNPFHFSRLDVDDFQLGCTVSVASGGLIGWVWNQFAIPIEEKL